MTKRIKPLIEPSYSDAEVCREEPFSRTLTTIKTIPCSGNAQPSDFVAYNGPVVFEQDQVCSTVPFIIKKDNIDEDEEVFEVSLAEGKTTRFIGKRNETKIFQ